MTHELSNDQAQLLREVIERQAPGNSDLLTHAERGTLDKEQRARVCRLIAAELCRSGLSGDDEPNDRGIALEHLLDTVNRPREKNG